MVCDESGLEVASASRLLTSAQRGHSRRRTASIRIFGKSRRSGASSPDGEVAIPSVDWSQRLRVLPMIGRVPLSRPGGRGPLTWGSNQSCEREQRRVLSRGSHDLAARRILPLRESEWNRRSVGIRGRVQSQLLSRLESTGSNAWLSPREVQEIEGTRRGHRDACSNRSESYSRFRG